MRLAIGDLQHTRQVVAAPILGGALARPSIRHPCEMFRRNGELSFARGVKRLLRGHPEWLLPIAGGTPLLVLKTSVKEQQELRAKQKQLKNLQNPT